jgi:DNA-directed RNA polymerase specialized sigma24 family protein
LPLNWDGVWPEVSERVRRTLKRRGAPEDTIDDALQSAAMKALCHTDGFDCPQGMVRWVTVVAWNEVQAEWRRRARLQVGNLPEQPSAADPAVDVALRLELDAVADGLARLSDAERRAVFSGIARDQGPCLREDAPSKMRRYRARQHLAQLVDW